jgi:hypothetical protein
LLWIPLVWLATPSAQTLPQIQKKSLETHIQEVTGPPASVVSCGEYGIQPPATTPYNLTNLQNSLACARDAARHSKPFRIVVQGVSEDSRTAYGVLSKVVAGRDQGVVWFEDDSAPCGGPYCAERFETSFWYVQDIVVFVNEQGQYQLGRLKR